MCTPSLFLEFCSILQPGTYVLGFIDLHWNTSEHSIQGQKTVVEAQLHHFDLNYDSYEEASKVDGALLSIAVGFEVIESFFRPTMND